MSGRTGRASPSYGDYDPSSGRQQQRASSSNAGPRSGFTSRRSRPRKYGDQEDTSRRSSSAGGFIPPRRAPPTYDSYTQSGMMGYGGAAPSSYASYASYGTYSAYGNGMSAYGYANTYGNGSGYGYDSTRGYHSTASNFAYNDPNNNTSSGYSSYRLASSSSSTSQPTFSHQYSAYTSTFDQDPALSQPASMHPPQSGQPKLNPLEAMLQRAREQTRRSRSSSPTPPGTTSSSRTSTKPSSKASSPPPRPTEPSEEYLRTTLQPSTRISNGDPKEGSRKLIVLDLNGSLVLRSAHVTASARKAAAGANSNSKSSSNPTQGAYARPPPALRTVHPRPYLAPFVEYILHEKTKKWLDIMVWSSAQPHSVEDMVGKVFGGGLSISGSKTGLKDMRSDLRAVWARDTLGLSEGAYHRKTQTVKNLEKPWAELPYSHSTMGTQHHSAQTTLLIDDSPLKAALQPWNHLCIEEYVSENRKRDLAVAAAKSAGEAAEKAREEEVRTREHLALSGGVSLGTSGATTARPWLDDPIPGPDEGVAKKTKRMKKKEAVRKRKEEEEAMLVGEVLKGVFGGEEDASGGAKEAPMTMGDTKSKDAASAVANMVNKPTSHPNPTSTSTLVSHLKYDETLLAVVGILDTIKYESNVSGWMRGGGLVKAPFWGKDSISSGEGAIAAVKEQDGSRARSTSRSTTPVPPPAKRRKVEAGGAPEADADAGMIPMDSDAAPPSSPVQPPPSSQMTASEDVGVKANAAMDMDDIPSSSLPPPPQGQGQEVGEQAATGVPLVSLASATGVVIESTSTTTTISNAAGAIPISTAPGSKAVQPLWYTNPTAMSYWAERGRKALSELGIRVESGIVSSP